MYIWMASYLQRVCQHISFVRKLKMYLILIYWVSEFWGVYICSFNKIFWFFSSVSSHIFLCPRRSLSLSWFLWMFGLQREDFEQIVEGPYIIYNCDPVPVALLPLVPLENPIPWFSSQRSTSLFLNSDHWNIFKVMCLLPPVKLHKRWFYAYLTISKGIAWLRLLVHSTRVWSYGPLHNANRC